jgi:co-chaperonin GroES (HSP10)
MRTFRPLGNRVLAEIEHLRMTKGGLHIPDNSKQDEVTGIIKMIGDEVKYLKVGDRILINPRVGAGMVEGEIIYRIVEESGVICVVEGEKDPEPLILLPDAPRVEGVEAVLPDNVFPLGQKE